MATSLFEIDNLHVQTVPAHGESPVQILRGASLKVLPGEIHALMGPRGSGKSALASTLLGAPGFEITSGSIRLRGDDITDWGTDVRAKAGLFLAFQNPQELPGVSVLNFMRQALGARKGIELSVPELRLALTEWIDRLEMDPSFLERHLNEGSGSGENKRSEILQMAMLEPEMAILDETDSGLEVDVLRTLAKGVRKVRAARPELGVLAITHYERLVDYLEPDVIHVMLDGAVVASGGPDLTARLEHEGYEGFRL